MNENCKHEDMYSDGTTNWCADCGQVIEHFVFDSQRWERNTGDKRWSEEGWK